MSVSLKQNREQSAKITFKALETMCFTGILSILDLINFQSENHKKIPSILIFVRCDMYKQ